MSTGIITSFVIGGVLLLAILAMNLNISHSSTQLTMRQITQQHVQTISELLNYDIPKAGFDTYSSISNPITLADSNKIIFKGNLDNSGAQETVQWYFNTSSPVTSTPNPDDYALSRTVDGSQTDLNVGITAFQLTYLDKDRNVLSTPISTQTERNKIRHIKINLTVSSKEKLGSIGSGNGEYVRSFWEKTFAPLNLAN